MKKKLIFSTAICGFFLLLSGSSCDNNGGKQQSDSGAKQVTLDFKIPLNSMGLTMEQQNIYDRLVVTTDPTKILWIHLIALDGKIIRRMPLVSKVTSSGKRLEPRHAADAYQSSYPSAGNGHQTDEFLQPDGTYGESDSYIFWFDPQHRYHQWGTAGGLGYLLTDYPIDLQNPIDEITGMYKMNILAFQWQQLQEKNLKEKEKVAYAKWQAEMRAKKEQMEKDSLKK